MTIPWRIMVKMLVTIIMIVVIILSTSILITSYCTKYR